MKDIERLKRRVQLIEQKVTGNEPENLEAPPSLATRVRRLERDVHGIDDREGLETHVEELRAELDAVQRRLDEIEE
ncbi:hypothetical protein [Halegenticoccus tardaugens]|uniref:hypothetical protein n=1 Tax=Halegenticoccus tardaugens TaxID=2071624 RepID=UPI00100A2738|nr:hypothetical protein [Halegenticoccus tardaugens]